MATRPALSPAERVAIQQERQRKREQKQREAVAKEKDDPRGAILPREWVRMRDTSVPAMANSVFEADGKVEMRNVKVMSWNVR